MALPDENDLLKPEAKVASPEIEVHIEDEPELEVIDDTPVEDRNKRPLPEDDKEPTEEELEQYSEAVQKRIRKETHRFHDQRRLAEAAQRERDEAIRAAQQLFADKKALEARYNLGEDAFISQAKEKSELAMAAAKKEYKAAYELGDADKMADAQEKMALVATERREAETWARNAAQRKESAGQEEKALVQRQPSQQQAAPAPDSAAQEWAEKNKWFGSNKRMTNMAYALHDELVEEGLDPGRDASKYYKKLNAGMREVFPTFEWEDAPKKKSITSVVAPVTRTSKATTRVTLTQSQVAVAKRMGVTPLQYAIELAKLENQA